MNYPISRGDDESAVVSSFRKLFVNRDCDCFQTRITLQSGVVTASCTGQVHNASQAHNQHA